MKLRYFDTTVNDHMPEEFGAKMLDYSTEPVSYTNGYLEAEGGTFPVRLKAKRGLRAISMVFDFEAKSQKELAINISQFTALLQEEAVNIMLPDGFYYWCEFDGASTPAKMAPWIQQVEFRLTGVRHEAQKEHILTETDVVEADGNMESPLTVELTRATGATSMQFMGITITDAETAIIDGIYMTVTDENGNNIFLKTDITEWPKFSPGENTVTMTGVSEAKIAYFPIWL